MKGEIPCEIKVFTCKIMIHFSFQTFIKWIAFIVKCNFGQNEVLIELMKNSIGKKEVQIMAIIEAVII